MTVARRWWSPVLAGLFGTAMALLLAEAGLSVHAQLVHGGATDRGGMSGRLTSEHERFGWVGRAGAVVDHRTTEFDVTYRIDQRGFRQLPDDGLQIRQEGPRLALLGDSFLFGQGVLEELRLSVLLSRSLDCEVSELALPGSGTGQQLLYYEEFSGRHHGADIVVLGYLPEHIERTVAPRRSGRGKPWFVLEGGELALEGVPVPAEHLSLDQRAERQVDGLGFPGKLWMQRNSRLYSLIRQHFRGPLLRLTGRDLVDPHPGLLRGTAARAVTTALMKRLADQVVAEGGRLLVVFLPELWHSRHGYRREHQEAVAEMAAAAGASFTDLTKPLASSQESGGQPYFAIDGHWKTAGHEQAADALGRALRELGWLAAPR
ncbi:MAG: hypothetical protein ACI9EF_002929 [Pseudohongiellaceae bacterium]|jgi:hypothetical protein